VLSGGFRAEKGADGTEVMARYIYYTVAAVQAMLHYLGALSIIFGVIGYVFGTFEHRRELIIGGMGCLIVKHLIRAIYSFSLQFVQDGGAPLEQP
jgi:membrane associated rhomboid family serine protease